MKTRIALLGSFLLLLPAAQLRASIPVIDIPAIEQRAWVHAEDLARFAEMIQNQIDQITVLADQLLRQDFIVRVLGDPLTNTALAGISQVLEDLNEHGVNVSRQDLLAGLDVRAAQLYDGGGIFTVVGDSFRTLDGKVVQREEAPYKPQAALVRTVANYDAVHADVITRRQALRDAMRETLEQLRQAATDAEAQKLHGVLLAQLADLEATDRELTFAANQAVLQEIETRNDDERQAKAAREEQAVENATAFQKFARFLRPDIRPVKLDPNHP